MHAPRPVREHYRRLGFIHNGAPTYCWHGPKLSATELGNRGFRFAALARLGADVSNLYMAGKL